MKAFVSGQINEKRSVRAVFDSLRALGIEVTHDWTVGDGLKDKASDPAEAGKRAAADITGVVAADLYILVSDNRSPGKGMYAELGAALALNELCSRPKVIVLGPMNHSSIFYYHPAVVHCRDLDDLEVLLATQASAPS